MFHAALLGLRSVSTSPTFLLLHAATTATSFLAGQLHPERIALTQSLRSPNGTGAEQIFAIVSILIRIRLF